MRALVLTHGSLGDVQPFIALAKALESAGHEAILAAPTTSASLATSYDLCLVPFHDMLSMMTQDSRLRRAVEDNVRNLHSKRTIAHAIYKNTELKAREFRNLIRELDNVSREVKLGVDIVVHHITLPAREIAEDLGVPAVPVCLQPFWVPTSSFPCPFIPWRLPRILNNATYLASKFALRIMAGNTAKWRREIVGLPRRSHRNRLLRPTGAPATVLQALSQHVLPSPMCYPEWAHTTGFWFPPATPTWVPPQTLSDFLASGDRPVYVGFGSTIGSDPRRTARVVTEAVQLAGVRAVVVAGWGGITADESIEDVLHIEHVPFEWLFPRMTAIVHHGGSGTIGAALSSGRPQVVCPFILDQHYYAKRVHDIGVASAPQPQYQLTSNGLANAIRLAVTDSEIAARAADVGHQIRTEGGVRAAVEILESLA